MNINDDIRPLNGLLIGTASAATQIEGGDRNNNWYEWAQTPGHVVDASSPIDGNDHWNRWRQDNELMAELGYPIVRLGLEWSRIEPRCGDFSSAALDRYREELGDLVDKGIKPLVTLHHFSNPLWFQHRGQFTHPASPWVFDRYVKETVSALSDLVDEWVTVNEPNVYATQAHLFRESPPGNISIRDLRNVLRHLTISHLRAYETIHEIQPDATVTIAHHLRDFAPMNPKNPLHQAFTAFNNYAFQDALTQGFGHGSFSPLLGKSPFPRGKYVDVIGLNYYSRTAVTGPSDGVFPGVPLNDLGWEIYPQGLVDCSQKLADTLGVPVWITENGTADNGDESHIESFRCRYIADHLGAILDSHAPIERYYHWCFVDNWEWSEGYVQRFGVVHNDYETHQRTIKPSAHMLSDIIAADGLTSEIINRYAAGQEYR